MIWYFSILGAIFAVGMIGEKEYKNKTLFAVGFAVCILGAVISKLI